MLMTQEYADAVEAAELGEVPLTEAQKNMVIYTKFESQDPMRSDTQHGEEWIEEVTAHPRMGLTTDEGCIIRFCGTRRGEVSIDPRTGEVLTQDEANLREDATGQNLPRYMAYDFRVQKLTKTNGPELRRNLMDTYDKQKADSESGMFDSIAQAFQSAVANLQSGGNTNPSPTDIQAFFRDMDGSQRKALIESMESEEDDISPPDDNEQVEDSGSKRGRSKK